MRNVVTKFIGKNEKGTVKKSIDVLRTELFAVNYMFNTLVGAQVYVNAQLLKLNENSLILEERQHLTPYCPPLELADIGTAKVDKTSLISVDTVKYSVPEEFIEILIENADLSAEDALNIFKGKTANETELHAISVVKPISQIDVQSGASMVNYALLVKGGANYDDHRKFR